MRVRGGAGEFAPYTCAWGVETTGVRLSRRPASTFRSGTLKPWLGERSEAWPRSRRPGSVDAMLVKPAGDHGRVEADPAADLDVGHTPFGDEPADVPDARPELERELVDGEELGQGVGGVHRDLLVVVLTHRAGGGKVYGARTIAKALTHKAALHTGNLSPPRRCLSIAPSSALRRRQGYAFGVSTLDEWDFTVPDDDGELLDELRHRGVRPGRRLRVAIVNDETAPPEDQEQPSRRRLSFAGSVHAEPDLSQRTDEYLRGFGRG